ncbi:hypothetical protein TUM17569_54610 [Klebsiella oxytoca]|nr:hypothetical protein TUM17569_54610 [Klebsiella oxytoca]GJL10783.1 hypothetical protein TUM17572_05900 [Klebsiella oxytoca]
MGWDDTFLSRAVNQNKRYKNVSYYESEPTAEKATTPNNLSSDIRWPVIRL